MKKEYLIVLRGCHDTTYMISELTEEEYNTIKEISKLSEEMSYYDCKPTMFIYLMDREKMDYEIKEIEHQKKEKKIEEEELKRKYNNFKF